MEALTSSGLINAAANRRALRVGEEPLDVFRRYMATFSQEQAYCHLSPALVSNLEEHWNAHERKRLRRRSGTRSRPGHGSALRGAPARAAPRHGRARRSRASLSVAARFAEAGIADAREIASLDDLARLPFSRKSDLRENYPFGLLAVPREQVVRVHASSGSHGKPTVVGYTRADLEAWTEVMARCMTMAGVRPGMVVHNANGYGLFTGGLGFHYGGERIGATVIPVSGGFTARQAMLLSDLGGQALCATPSYALVIAQAIREAGIDPADLAARARPLRRRALDRGDARPARPRARPWTRSTSTGYRRCAVPGVAAECRVARTGYTCRKTTSWSRCSTPRRATRCPRAPMESWSSPP